MLSRLFLSLSLSLSLSADIDVFVAPREKARAPSHIWTDEEMGVFLSLMQGDETTIGDFNQKLGKDAEDEFEGGGCGCQWNRTAAVSSPFFTMVFRDEWLMSFDYAIVLHSIHLMLKNSVHSVQ